METMVQGLSRALIQRGHDVTVVTLDRSVTSSIALQGTVHEGVPYTRLPRLGPRRYPFARGLLPHLRGAQVVHAHGLDGLTDQVVAMAPLHGAAVGISTHGGYFHTQRHRRLKRFWVRTGTRLTLGRAAVWFTSEADRALLVGTQGTVLGNGVDLARFAGLQRAPEVGQWLVLGRVDVHKGLDDLLPLLPAGVTLHVVGPEARPGLLRALKRPGVEVHGTLTDEALRPLLERCELALFPSRYEGFGLAAVELMGAGMPVVLSRIPAFDALEPPYRVNFRANPDLAWLLGADHRLASARARGEGPVLRLASEGTRLRTGRTSGFWGQLHESPWTSL